MALSRKIVTISPQKIIGLEVRTDFQNEINKIESVIARRGASPDEAIQSCIFLVCRAPTGLAMTDSIILILSSILWTPACAGVTSDLE